MNYTHLFGTAAVALATLASLESASAGEWTVAEATSSVGFVGEQQGTKFNGRFESFDAQIDFDPGMAASGSIAGTVDVSTVNTRDHDRDAALLDSDWFDSANYPEAHFESTSIKKLDDGSYEAEGQLEIKGKTKPARLAFTWDQSDGTAKFDGKMTINRFDFNIGEGWNDTSWVGQNVQVQIKLDLAANPS